MFAVHLKLYLRIAYQTNKWIMVTFQYPPIFSRPSLIHKVIRLRFGVRTWYLFSNWKSLHFKFLILHDFLKQSCWWFRKIFNSSIHLSGEYPKINCPKIWLSCIDFDKYPYNLSGTSHSILHEIHLPQEETKGKRKWLKCWTISGGWEKQILVLKGYCNFL